MVQDPNQQKDVQAVSMLVQYIAQKVSITDLDRGPLAHKTFCLFQKIDVNYVLTQHDMFVKDAKIQVLPQNMTSMTTLVYYYVIEAQYNNLFMLLNETKNMEL